MDAEMQKTIPVACVALLLCVAANAGKKPKKPSVDQRLLSAQYVCIVSASGSDVDSRTQDADREAILRVENAMDAWGRYHVMYNPQNADIVLEVRTGRIAGANAGGPIPAQPMPVPGVPGPTGSGVSVGVGAPNSGDAPITGGSEMDVSNVNEDMISIYDARVGFDDMKDPAVLWRGVMAHGLSVSPNGTVPLVEALKKAVTAAEKAAKKP